MACKLRLNVVCSSRDKRFLVIADEDWLLEDIQTCVEVVFHKLYPNEQNFKVAKLQNEFHFDLALDYRAGDALVDTSLLFAVEDDQPSIDRSIPSMSPQHEEEPKQEKKKMKRKKKSKIRSKKTCNTNKAEGADVLSQVEPGCTSSDKVTSTTGSPLHAPMEDCNLMPQVIEKVLCEDTEVDVETLEDL